ncbi:DUF58 domain-containing protein [Isosphaeraceae bacterium EP7]
MPLLRKRRTWAQLSRWARQRQRCTWEGAVYALVWAGLLMTGIYQQINLIFLVAGLVFGPIFASLIFSSRTVRKVRVHRRVPAYLFCGDPLNLDYTLDNDRKWTAALAISIEDHLIPLDRTIPGSSTINPRIFFARVPSLGRGRLRWQGPSPARGRYMFSEMDMKTRSPFGLLEWQDTVGETDELVVYPQVGQLARRWYVMQREASETRRGSRHDVTAQQQEYHGMRDYRSGDSPRWVHWRTSARVGQLMVKEFEQQHEQDLAILIDPWLPRTKVTPEQRESLELAIRFVATVCLETCRHQGRRLILGWTGPTPGLRQGPASIKLLHELLEHLATLKGSPEGQLSALFDALPPATLREAILVVISTRPLNLTEEGERSARLSGASARGLLGRVISFDASKGDLNDLIQFGKPVVQAAASRREADDVVFDRISSTGSREVRRASLSGESPHPRGPQAPAAHGREART